MTNIKNIDFIEGSNVAILEDYSVEQWNAMAKRQNTKMFIQEYGREPVDYNEVKAWIMAGC